MSTSDLIEKTKKILNNHEKWMCKTINLIASENLLSPFAKKCLTSDLGNRVAEGWIGERIFPGIKYYDEIEQIGIDVVKEMFRCDFVDLRPISGTHANMIVYTAFTKPNDKVLSFSIKNGGHISMSGGTPKNMFKLQVLKIPTCNDGFTIDVPSTLELLLQEKPKLLILGGSVLLFKQEIKAIVQLCKSLEIITVFDASHVAGLIATGDYENPMDVGVDIMTFSTCKTIPGPQHAVIIANGKYGDIIKKTTFPSTVSGHHLHETVSAIVTLLELKAFGKLYIQNVIQNSRTLARSLSELDLNILFKDREFTETHMLLMKNESKYETASLEKRFENANIIFNRNILPGDLNFKNPSGFRIGTPEITRIGMTTADMPLIAQFIADVYFDRKKIEKIKEEVISFREDFQIVKYCYE
ncbi:serine hydroxymethyltransferase [Myroides sp. WP-1]|uniref:serine hydroxymethyltransferase n=1 Tax=Myroides sp. WP-1 TaxID=2759944 RepID=UPI0015FD550C|nr:serine hydroxymethyltransferase [Myroides sp. WP-1]MBB1138422.1 serine hydroxymethyltransferase [Myroides sp. WP-1]